MYKLWDEYKINNMLLLQPTIELINFSGNADADKTCNSDADFSLIIAINGWVYGEHSLLLFGVHVGGRL